MKIGTMHYILKLLSVMAASSLAVTHGHYYQGLQNANSFFQPLQYSPLAYRQPVKQIPAFLPQSPTFQVEIMKPKAQFEEQKTVTLFIIPESALHVFPNVQRVPARFHAPVNQYPELAQLMGDPSHLPAIEIPLQSPMVVGNVKSQVLAPAGFTVQFKGPFGASLPFQIQTGALLAPVPVGTIISAETPVLLNTIYAVPSLPSLPSYYPLYVDYPKSVGPNKGVVTAVPPLTQRLTTTLIPSSPVNLVGTFPTDLSTSTGVYIPSPIPTTTPTLLEQAIRIDNELSGREPSVIPETGPDGSTGFQPQPFSNSKESPYLQELRDQSVQYLQAEITKLQNELAKIRSN